MAAYSYRKTDALIVPVASLGDEISVFPDEKKLKKFCLENGADIVLIKEAVGKQCFFGKKDGRTAFPRGSPGGAARDLNLNWRWKNVQGEDRQVF